MIMGRAVSLVASQVYQHTSSSLPTSVITLIKQIVAISQLLYQFAPSLSEMMNQSIYLK